MKIVHICTTSPFTENMLYQENVLLEKHIEDGHDAVIFANYDEYKLGKLSENHNISNCNNRVKRFGRVKFFNNWISRKLQLSIGLYDSLAIEKPDVILYHNIYGLDLLSLNRYKKVNPKVRIFIDSHADSKNSAQNFFSKFIFHRLFIRFLIFLIDKNIDRYLFVGDTTREFILENYKINKKKIGYFPLAFNQITKEEKVELSEFIRKKYSIRLNEKIFIHAGKFNKKKKTIEIIKSLLDSENSVDKLILAGSFDQDIEHEAKELISENEQIIFLGWVDGLSLRKLIAGSDLFIQLGTVSINFQLSLSVNTPAAVFPDKNYTENYSDRALFIDSNLKLKNLFNQISNDREYLNELNKKFSLHHNQLAEIVKTLYN